MDNLNNDVDFGTLKSKMGITYQDEVAISPQLMPNYTDKVKKRKREKTKNLLTDMDSFFLSVYYASSLSVYAYILSPVSG